VGAVVAALGLGVLTTGLGAEVLGLGGVLALWLGKEALMLRLGERLEIALWTAPPQPAVRHPATMATKRKMPCV